MAPGSLIRVRRTSEADVLNVALFGVTAKQWREENPDKSGVGINEYRPVTLDELISNNTRFKGFKAEMQEMQEILHEPIDKLENICKNTVKGEHA